MVQETFYVPHTDLSGREKLNSWSVFKKIKLPVSPTAAPLLVSGARNKQASHWAKRPRWSPPRRALCAQHPRCPPRVARHRSRTSKRFSAWLIRIKTATLTRWICVTGLSHWGGISPMHSWVPWRTRHQAPSISPCPSPCLEKSWTAQTLRLSSKMRLHALMRKPQAPFRRTICKSCWQPGKTGLKTRKWMSSTEKLLVTKRRLANTPSSLAMTSSSCASLNTEQRTRTTERTSAQIFSYTAWPYSAQTLPTRTEPEAHNLVSALPFLEVFILDLSATWCLYNQTGNGNMAINCIEKGIANKNQPMWKLRK